ncbi:tol-pal system-associated acyl-CoA thioesterase [Pseudoxanthomonas dokdonensis]|uniref:Acyl-CoA thioesterase n=1 Tax=Pseudoxanthomonas dokdonensis TaxID=344882 RepID=A0A0R0CNA0_9GAMM|nr:tol-pal system-associated acyl-CoA thioesterase [Pseudoxanthomonas dokdonensis]KRG71497.1 acyl-CoA thioesterase [Pseudoxanthomonas dokdonensis]
MSDGDNGVLFSWPTRIYWEDTDAGGVVYHARYVAFLERARTEWLRAMGHAQEDLRQAHDLVFAVRAMQLDFVAPARLDDLLQVQVGIQSCKRASVVFGQRILREGQLLVSAQVKVACLGASLFKPKPLPEPLYRQFTQLQPDH